MWRKVSPNLRPCTRLAELEVGKTPSTPAIDSTLTPEFPIGVEPSTRSLLSRLSAHEQTDGSASVEPRTDVCTLNALALRSLVSLFNEREQLFAQRVRLAGDGLHWDETSRKRTILALLGLQRLVESGGTQPFDLASIRDAVLQDTSWVKEAGDLGLLAWFVAVCLPSRLEKLFKDFDFENALMVYPDGRQGRTTGVALFLTGAAHARLARPESVPDLTDVTVDAYRMLKGNQSEDGIFGHAAFPGFPRTRLYNYLGTFSDQIYAIYALSMFARAFQIEEPLESALGCANAICSLQGEMGQWWFLYDKRTTRVVTRYPVCTLHQDGTAPCGLLAVEEATGQSFQKAIFRGLSWIAGENELENDFRNPERAFIWDSIGPQRRFAKYWESAFGFMRGNRKTKSERLAVQYEARPDHFGWLLYAFGRYGLPNGSSR